MFTFFKYKNGEPIPFRKLRYSDIENFINDDWEEGYTIEFKESFDSSVKSKIPAIFTSFANSEGGLLIIGIKDNSKTIVDIEKPRGEVYATMSQLIENRITPLAPKFYARFIENPKKKGYGVIIVYVEEGIVPPYIANGTIYVREANRKYPIKPERPTVDYLYKKRELTSNIALMSISESNALSNDLIGRKFEFYSENLKVIQRFKKEIELLVEKIKKYDLSSFDILNTAIKTNTLLSSLSNVASGLSEDAESFFKNMFEGGKKLLEYLDIEFDDEFFNLHGLRISTIINQWNYSTQDERKNKAEDIRKLIRLMEKYISAQETTNCFENCYEFCFVINNLGNKFDEDIVLSMKFPPNTLFNLMNEDLYSSDSNACNNYLIKCIENPKIANIEDFDNYNIVQFSAMPPLKGMMGTELDYDDKEYLFEKFYNELKNTLNYEVFTTKEADIIKIRFNKILAKQVMFLPCKIITKTHIKEVEYEILSKNSASLNKGMLVRN